MKVFLKGVYMLFDGETVVYVGQSSDIYRRIYEHSSGRAKGEKKHFDSWEYFEVEDEQDRNRMEYILIKSLKPKYNIDTECRFQTRMQNRENEVKNILRKSEEASKDLVGFYGSVSATDLDSIFELPRGTFCELIRKGSIDKADVVYLDGILSGFVPRIKNEKVFEILGRWLNASDRH